MVAQNIAFGLIAVVMIVAAFRVVTTSNIVHAALWLVAVLSGVAALYILLIAEFTAMVQVLVYIGAIVVLFLFGIMLTRAPVDGGLQIDRRQAIMGGTVAVALFALLGFVLWDSFDDVEIDLDTAAAASADLISVVPAGSDAAQAAEDSYTKAVIEPDDVELGVARVRALVDEVDGEVDVEAVSVDVMRIQLDPDAVAVIDPSNTKSVSDSVFSDYIVPFEAISVLLLAALIGAIVLARKE